MKVTCFCVCLWIACVIHTQHFHKSFQESVKKNKKKTTLANLHVLSPVITEVRWCPCSDRHVITALVRFFSFLFFFFFASPGTQLGISLLSLCDICIKSKEAVSCERATSSLRSLQATTAPSRPWELIPTALHTAPLHWLAAPLWPEPGWMTFRRPPPRLPASAVQLPASPKWSCVCLAKPCWTETRWISQTPVS